MPGSQKPTEAKRTLTGEKVSPSYMAHVVLRTTRKAELVDWYATVLGTEPVFESDELSFATFDTEHHRLAIVQLDWEASEVDGISSVDHIAYTMASLEDLLNTYLRLKGEGILPTWPIHHGPTISLYYRDPDGNNIELQTNAFPTLEECKRYIQEGADFRENSIGIEFDPDAMVEAYESGVAMETILQRGTLPKPASKPERTLGPGRKTQVLKL